LVHIITQPFKGQDVSIILNTTRRRGRKAFENVCRIFLGNEKEENYSEIVQELISSYRAM
jgi:hypothetical protein